MDWPPDELTNVPSHDPAEAARAGEGAQESRSGPTFTGPRDFHRPQARPRWRVVAILILLVLVVVIIIGLLAAGGPSACSRDVRLTGKKASQKMYYRHSGYPGGLKARPYGELLEKNPVLLMRIAVKGMLPRTSLGRAMLRKLKVYAGPEHAHAAQRPRVIAAAAGGSAPAGEGGAS